MAIVVKAPETVNDADINELYALEKHLIRSFLKVIQTMFTVVKAMILYLRRHY